MFQPMTLRDFFWSIVVWCCAGRGQKRWPTEVMRVHEIEFWVLFVFKRDSSGLDGGEE